MKYRAITKDKLIGMFMTSISLLSALRGGYKIETQVDEFLNSSVNDLVDPLHLLSAITAHVMSEEGISRHISYIDHEEGMIYQEGKCGKITIHYETIDEKDRV